MGEPRGHTLDRDRSTEFLRRRRGILGRHKAALGHDQFCLGRARSLEERAREIESITLGELNDYLRSRQFSEFTTASIGPVEPAVHA